LGNAYPAIVEVIVNGIPVNLSLVVDHMQQQATVLAAKLVWVVAGSVVSHVSMLT
jgi:hypothetical protein